MAEGTCDARFAEVGEEFERNFVERGEVGAAVAVTLDGQPVVDLWGGVADPESGRPWQQDTIAQFWSCTKGLTSLCAHVLATRGELDLDAPVVKYWPEFGEAGKEEIPVRWLLTHQAGLAALVDPIPDDGLCDWDDIVDRLARQAPLWEPGTRHGYHALTFGHLVGEVVRRVTGASLGTVLRDEITGPLGLDLWIGLPEEHEARVATNLSAEPDPTAPLPRFYEAALTDPTSIAGLVMMNSGGYLFPGATNRREIHAAEIPSVNGIGNARSLAGLYRPLALGGGVDGVRLVDEAALLRMGAVASATAVDATMLVPTRWSLGFMKANDNRHLPPGDNDSVLLSETAFGYLGAGGSLGFADPAARLSFGYTMNRQGATVGLDERGQSLVDAVYRALGHRQPDGGIWVRAQP
jgi:CubicO group peptidase (beta-lactamase class C family)